jgi:hypothetical protein
VQREATANGATTADGPQLGKGAAAAVCFEAALDLLAKYPALEPGDQRSQSQQRPEADILALKAKCLTQLALAHHLEGRHDDALACLDGVPLDSALRSISQELRFGILLAASFEIPLCQERALSFYFILPLVKVRLGSFNF